MIKVFSIYNKGTYEIIAVAEHQKDLNNLRLMSYRLNQGKDKLQLNKDKYGGPYLRFKCDDLLGSDGACDVAKLENRIADWQTSFN